MCLMQFRRIVRQNLYVGRRETAERQGRIELELMEERAAALRRISETLESLIEQLQALRGRIGDVHWSSPAPEVTEYREVRRRAVRYRWYLEVQREALGLHPDHRLDEFYRIPDPI
jgi:hypothetical protein